MSSHSNLTQSYKHIQELRSPDFGVIEGLAAACPQERSLEIFRRMSFIRYFDLRVRQAQLDKDVEFLGYLYGYKGLLTNKKIKIPSDYGEKISLLYDFGGTFLGNSRVKLTNAKDLSLIHI